MSAGLLMLRLRMIKRLADFYRMQIMDGYMAISTFEGVIPCPARTKNVMSVYNDRDLTIRLFMREVKINENSA